MKTDAIRILLVDDEPKGFYARTESGPKYPAVYSDPDDPIPYSDLFDVRWLASPGEARAFRDLSSRLSQRNPRLLASAGWVPELLVLDYALHTNGVKSVETSLSDFPDLLRRVSPLPLLREACKRHGIQVGAGPVEFNPTSINIQRDENFGCFVGGLLLSTFSQHPCVPITNTFRPEEALRGGYTEFFQWLLADQCAGYLAPEPKESHWQPLLHRGVKRLQDRIKEYAARNLIAVSLREIMALTSVRSGQDLSEAVLTIESRYGIRRYPSDLRVMSQTGRGFHYMPNQPFLVNSL